MTSALLLSTSSTRFGITLRQNKTTSLSIRGRVPVVVKATWSPDWESFANNSKSELSLHGVLHSANLPSTLAESVGVYDALDAIEACTGLWGDEKEACFAIFGVDGAADEFVDVVFNLENAYQLDTLPEEDSFHHGIERC